ncbi:MAG: N-acetyltransferase [Chitinophagaceae bacterium]|nr:N-acetyltransferase [Chitinophagaceae bacterium]
MTEVKLQLDDKGHGHFYIMEEEAQMGEMVVGVADGILTAYHTEVAPRAEGKGLAKQLLEAMTDYARKHHLKVVPLCNYVHSQFKRHAEQYTDLWKQPE